MISRRSPSKLERSAEKSFPCSRALICLAEVKQTITSISCLLAGCSNPEAARGPVSIHQDQASTALEENTSPIQDQVSTTLESSSIPSKMSKFRHLEPL